ncbi:MAG: leucine-rich repeat protein [Alistipes sp.]|nr:leucine-rich repeat protein [Alistipes sp.]
MKRLFTLLLISFVALSCEMIDEKLVDLLGKRDWVIFAEGTELAVNVPSKQTVLNYKFESILDWEATPDVEWLEVDPTSGTAGKDIKIQIKVEKNKEKEGRTGYVYLTVSNSHSVRITINQAGEGDENDENNENDENEGVIVDIPNNQIWYTSLNGEVVEPYDPMAFNTSIISNTYTDNKGVIVFDRDVTTIGYCAFTNCIPFTSVTIPDSVTSIENDAFSYCLNLTNVTVPDSVTYIGDFAFYHCEGLVSATLGNSVEHIGFKAFDGCIELTEITIPESVISIGAQAFFYCISLSSFKGKFATEDGLCLIVNGNLNAIAIGRDNIGDYVIPNSVNNIEMYSIYFCHSMTSVTIPDSVTIIGEGAFKDCDGLTTVNISDSVIGITSDAFIDCNNLNSVYCKPTTPPTALTPYGFWWSFDLNAPDRKIYVPMESVEAYKSAEYWSDYADAIVGYDF